MELGRGRGDRAAHTAARGRRAHALRADVRRGGAGRRLHPVRHAGAGGALRARSRRSSTRCPRSPTTTGASTRSTCGSCSATERPEQIDAAIALIEARTGLPVLEPAQARGVLPRAEAAGMKRPLDATDRAIVRATQAGLPLCRAALPRDRRAAGAGARRRSCSACAACSMRASSAASAPCPNHYALGYRANGMSVWDVEDDRVPELGPAVGALPFVSHCYRRPRHPPLWPYNLFAMVHGRDARGGRGQGGARSPRCSARPAPRPRRALQHPHPEEDRAPARRVRRKHVPSEPVHARADRAHAGAARDGRRARW